jgi:hypothetical protein
LNRGPNAGARSQMHDYIDFFTTKHSSHRVVLSKINVANRYVFRETSDVRVLDLRIVKIIEIVQNDDFMANAEQLLYQVRPDKPGATCDQDSHKARS